jgi:anti-sigma regulatory factor (Ser/Thr protein kinase)
MVSPGSRHFEPTPQSVRAVRSYLREVLGDADEEVLADAELLASEVSANVVAHALTDYEVRVLTEGDRVRIEIADGSSVIPAIKDMAEDSEEGRGLVLLEGLADAWGAEERAGGKIVWFELTPSRRQPEARP